MKFVPGNLVRAHYATLVNANTGARMWQDFAWSFGPAVVAGGAVGVARLHLSDAVGAALLTVTGLLSAFLFSVMLQTAQRAMEWAESRPPRGQSTSQLADLLEELAANAGYSALVAIAAAVAFVLTTALTGTAALVFLVCGVALGVHMVVVLLMVINRVFLVTQAQLRIARTTGDLRSIDDHDRRAS